MLLETRPGRPDAPTMGVAPIVGVIIEAIPKFLNFVGSGDREQAAAIAAEQQRRERNAWIFGGGLLAAGVLTAILISRR
jgi:hypothetical protein